MHYAALQRRFDLPYVQVFVYDDKGYIVGIHPNYMYKTMSSWDIAASMVSILMGEKHHYDCINVDAIICVIQEHLKKDPILNVL
jgi:hypothetical protein